MCANDNPVATSAWQSAPNEVACAAMTHHVFGQHATTRRAAYTAKRSDTTGAPGLTGSVLLLRWLRKLGIASGCSMGWFSANRLGSIDQGTVMKATTISDISLTTRLAYDAQSCPTLITWMVLAMIRPALGKVREGGRKRDETASAQGAVLAAKPGRPTKHGRFSFKSRLVSRTWQPDRDPNPTI